MSESLVYKRAADLVGHALRYLKKVDHQQAEQGQTPAKLPQSVLQALANTFGRTIDRRVQALLRTEDGAVLHRAEAGEFGESEKLDLETQLQGFNIDSAPIRTWQIQTDSDESNPTLICGQRLEAACWSGSELWLLVPRCTPNTQELLSHVQTWRNLLTLFDRFKTLLDVKHYLAASRDLFDDENRETFLSSEARKKLENLKLNYLPAELNPAVEDALRTLVQAALLVDVNLPFERNFSNQQRQRIDELKRWIDLIAPGPREDLAPDHLSLIDVLEALFGEVGSGLPKEDSSNDQGKLWWLSRLTALLHQLDRNGTDQNWEAMRPAMTSATARFLAEWSPHDGRQTENGIQKWEPRGFRANYISPWLRLWLCYELMRHELDPNTGTNGVSSARLRRYRRALVYVLRETVRFFLFGRRADYRFRPRLLSRALRRLVVHHAEQVVGLDVGLDLAELLRRIERSGEASGRELATGHVQHVFEVYIAGEFLGSLGDGEKDCGKGDGKNYDSLWSHLAEKVKSTLTPRLLSPKLRRGFAVAALLHDFGNLLFPPGGSGLPTFRDLVRQSEPVLDQLKESLHGAARAVAGSALETLRRTPHLFTHAEWEAIERWQQERLARCGEPEPAILAAWYVHGLMAESGLEPEIHRHVVRAIVLDRVTTLTVTVEEDPVAALLMVCDALFAWNPRSPRHPEALIGRTFSSLHGAGRHLAAQYDTLTIPGLTFRLKETGHGTNGTRATVARFTAKLPAGRKTLLPSFKISSGVALRGDPEAVLALWLDLSIALGRVQDTYGETGETKPRPWIEILSACDGSLVSEDFQLTDLVTEAAQRSSAPLRRALERWLARLKAEKGTPDKGDGTTEAEEKKTTPSEVHGTSERAKATEPDNEPSAKLVTDKQSQRLVFQCTGGPFADRDPSAMLDELTGHLRTVILEQRAARR